MFDLTRKTTVVTGGGAGDAVPLRRLGTPDDIGSLCVYLASDEAGWITGETIQATGGSRVTVGYLTYLHRVTEQLNAVESET